MMTDEELREIYDHEENMYTFDEALSRPTRSRWWKCSKNHSYQRSLKNQRKLCSCPVCSNDILVSGINDLATVRPDLVIDWDNDKNKGITPDMVIYISQLRVDWKCHVCGYEWNTMLNCRTRYSDSGCPACNDSNKSNVPAARLGNRRGTIDTDAILASEFDVDKNVESMQAITLGSMKNVWWKCRAGHSYRTRVCYRSGKCKSGCRECFTSICVSGVNDLVTLNSWVIKEWDYDNNYLSPNEVTLGSPKYVNWICSTCGTKWSATTSQRVRGVSLCPKCKKISKEVIANER